MVEATAKLMTSNILSKDATDMVNPVTVPKDIMKSTLWSKDQVKLAFHLYCQIPFGKIDSRNKQVISLAKIIGRTPSAVAMKMLNISSLDPAITNSGRSGLGNASSLDREVWDEFHADWERLAVESQLLREQLEHGVTETEEPESNVLIPEDFTGETRRVLTEQRIKQSFFRKAVMSSYRGRCCMSGLSEPKLLIASHIVPWSKDKTNRLNPSNGLCLSAIHDRAFDKGFITLSESYEIVVSEALKARNDNFIRNVILPLEGKLIELPERFIPSSEFLARHRREVFQD
jgi:hypothetical protein